MTEQEAKRQRYQLESVLGTGGQGRTYRARDVQTGRPVAVKVIELRGMTGWKSYDLFAREVQALQSLSHPGIPAFLDTYEAPEEGKYFLVMELIEGETLDHWMRARRTLSEAEARDLLGQALDILEYLHGRMPPIIHRDIKPANLARRPDGRLALLDFGGVRSALRPEGGSTMVGTFGYMAPEQLHGAALPATDIYGLGATMVALLTGTEPERLPRKGLKLDLEAALPAGPLREVLAKMLEPDPELRLGSVRAVREALAPRPVPVPVPVRGPVAPALGHEVLCGRCGRANPTHFRFCLDCGNDLRDQPAVPAATTPCPRCQNPLPAGATFLWCGRCGYDSRQDQRSLAVVSPPQPLAVPTHLPWVVQLVGSLLKLMAVLGVAVIGVVLPLIFGLLGGSRNRRRAERSREVLDDVRRALQGWQVDQPPQLGGSQAPPPPAGLPRERVEVERAEVRVPERQREEERR